MVRETLEENYQKCLVKFFCYHDGVEYPKDHQFSPEQLNSLTYVDIMRYLYVRTFGTATPHPDANPTGARGNSIAYIKKAISSFIPNKHMQWCEQNKTGNPMRFRVVNELLHWIKHKETRKQGQPSKARRATKRIDYSNTVTVARREATNTVQKFGLPALMAFQFSTIGRVDDCCTFLQENLKAHNLFPQMALKAKLCWLKNVVTEAVCPFQMILGANDVMYCVLLNLAMWLELELRNGRLCILSPYVFAFSDDTSQPGGADKSKRSVQNFLRNSVFTDGEVFEDDDPLGTHAIRKYAGTECRK